ncbi:10070_t:CDS:2, partial [Acaulospora morrowiae]
PWPSSGIASGAPLTFTFPFHPNKHWIGFNCVTFYVIMSGSIVSASLSQMALHFSWKLRNEIMYLTNDAEKVNCDLESLEETNIEHMESGEGNKDIRNIVS